MANKDNATIGTAYRHHVKAWVESIGWDVIGENVRHESGVEFDIHCLDTYQREVGIECKASNNDAASPGLKRTDNVWKIEGYLNRLKTWARGKGFDLRDMDFRYVVVTSHLGDPGTDFRSALDQEELLGYITVIERPWAGWQDGA